MNNATQFKKGTDDPRRNRAGRPPSAASFRRQILKAIGPDLPAHIEKLNILARSGDPDALCALAGLVAAALSISPAAGSKGAPGDGE